MNILKNIFSATNKFTCPYCYAEHSIADCGLRCSYNIIGNADKKCKFDIKKYDDDFGNDWIPAAHKKKCLECKEAAKQLFCDAIKKEIPMEFLSMKSLPIALLGAKATGKSNYIGVLINEIKKKMTSPFNCSLSMTCSKESKETYDEMYYRPLYKEGVIIRGTDAQIEVPPLIFPLRFMDTKNKITNMAALTFYDTAGENLNSKDDMNKFNRYITNAHGIILLLDPLQVPKIRKDLSANGFTALPEQNTEIYDVLSIIIDVIRGVKNIKGQIEIPLALVFTKIDVLDQHNVLPETCCLKEESEHAKRGAFLTSDFENTNIQMRDLIENLLDDDLVGHIRQFKRHSFFGVSSLGGNPTNGKIDGNGIRPRRVLDPLLWLLAENKYIKTIKK
jgi:GTPase SAR1 family protein